MSLTAGDKVGPYVVVAPLGAGGMGEVYRARDTRLEREVALKVLPETMAADADALSRFEREAKAVAALSHPNILAIHDLGVEGGRAYSVTELLEGETLRARLGGSALPPRKGIDYGLQIARGLAAAHEKGIVHRDLKPENLFVTHDGRVKILDFGIAKLVQPVSGQALTAAPTVEPGTLPGTVMGTIGYMSPEQVRGGTVDHRSDLFSFGAVLYEMLSGARAFRGDTAADTMSAILKEDPPDLSQTGRNVAPGVERVVRHCLEKSPSERFQSARDVAFALEALSEPSVSGVAPAAQAFRERARLRLHPALAAGILIVAIAGAFAAGWLAAGSGASSPVQFQQLTFTREMIGNAAFAPDGKTIVYSAAKEGDRPELYMISPDFRGAQPMGVEDAHLLGVSSKGDLAILTHARALGYHRLFLGTLARMPLGSKAPRELIEKVREAAWDPAGDKLAIIHREESIDKLEYPPGHVLAETSGYFSDPKFSPNGDRIAFFDHPTLYDDRGGLAVVDLEGHKTVLSDGWWGEEGLAWAPDGKEIFFTAGSGYNSFTVYAATLGGRVRRALSSAGGLTMYQVLPDGRWLVARDDLEKRTYGRLAGEHSDRDLSWLELSDPADLSADGSTLLLTSQGQAAGDNYAVGVQKMDGSPVVRLGEGFGMALSLDGKQALAAVPTSPMQAVVYPVGPGEEIHLDRGPIEGYVWGDWFPDGKRVLLCGDEPGQAPRCYVQSVSGGPPKALTPAGVSYGSVSPNGKQVIAVGPDGWVVVNVADGKVKPVAGLPADTVVAGWTPDGRSVYTYNITDLPTRVERWDVETGKATFVREIEPADPTGVLRISSLVLAGDPNTFAYSVTRSLSTLFVVEKAR